MSLNSELPGVQGRSGFLSGLRSAARQLGRRRKHSPSGPPRREQVYSFAGGRLHADGCTLSCEDFVGALEQEFREQMTRALQRLNVEGVVFNLICRDRQGRHLDVTGLVRGAQVYLSVIDITRHEEVALSRQGKAVLVAAQAARQSDLLDHSPYLQWRMDEAGTVVWSNALSLRRSGMHAQIPDLLAERVRKVAPKEGVEQHRMSVQPADIATPTWFDVTLVAQPGGGILCYALAAERIMRAEAALSRFVETLTETFAHLPIGLAIFDRDRELGLFNPALADLLRLDPAWLAGRPTLSSFLNHLRERRALPDQRDFRRWREQLVTLGRDGGTQDFAEVWVQPSGRTLRVVGRPHPQGAVAFLLEDITPAVTLEQQFREGMTLRAAALDSRPGTHLIFDISGAAAFVGADFATLTGANYAPDALAAAGAIHEVLRKCKETFGAGPIWERVLSYVVGRSAQTEREPLVVPLRRDGVVLRVLELNPLPGGGTLLSFLAPEPVASHRVSDLKQAVDQAIVQGRSVTEPADIQVHVVDQGAGGLPCAQQDLIRRAGYNMLLAAVDVVPAGQAVTIALTQQGGSVVLTLTSESPGIEDKDIGATLPISLLRRYLAEAQGTVTVAQGDDFAIEVRVPVVALAGRAAVEHVHQAAENSA